MRIAILGTRGIPAAYGGFETFAEEISTRLVSRGHEVVVYGRHAFGARGSSCTTYKGVKLRSAPTFMHKYLETPLHAFTSFCDLFRIDVDVVLLCNAANSPFAFLPKLKGVPLVINVDGIERRRQKWNALGRLWYRLGERCSVYFATRVVADAQVIADYYKEKFGCSAAVIGYGAEPKFMPAGSVLESLGVKQNEYILYVSRLEPENNALGVIEGYKQSGLTLPLVIVGDAPYAHDYKRQLRAAASERVKFAGFQFGDAYRELRSNCRLYIQATEVGGTHPALVEAMAYGNCVIANDVPEHREVLSDCGAYYSYNNFAELALRLMELSQDQVMRSALGHKASLRASAAYSWDAITSAYEDLFQLVAS